MIPEIPAMHTIWIGALVAVPVVALVALICRLGVRSPATRHALWLVALLAFVAPSVVSLTSLPAWISELRPQQSPQAEQHASGVHDAATDGPEPATLDADGLVSGNSAAADHAFPQQREARAPAPTLARQSPRSLPVRSWDIPVSTPAASADELAAAPSSRSIPPAWRPAVRLPEQPSEHSEPYPAAIASEPGALLASEDVRPRGQTSTTPETASRTDAAPSDDQSVATLAGASPGWSGSAPSDDTDATADAFDRAHAQLAAWGSWARRVGASLRSAPPVSATLWLAGVLIASALVGLRIAFETRSLRRTTLPTPGDDDLLARAAARIGLRRPPELRFTHSRVSPMVTCGPRRRLIIPAQLWEELDERAREGVLLHEMAHIKRRDHWTHWLAAIVGLLYWWHPLTWLVRSRLADEADLACDAWVTSLMPARRREYATALLQATTFVSSTPLIARPHAGASLAMAASSTRRLSRRLTMVMTHKVRPRLNAPGTSIVGILAVLALVVLPGVACPPDEKEKADVREIHVSVEPDHHADHHGDLHDEPDSTFDQHMRDREHDDGHAHEHMSELMESLHELEARMQRLHKELAAVHADGPSTDAGMAFVVADAKAPRDSDAKLAWAYVLPEGRLQSLTTLMVRSDVPILVSPESERLVVHATKGEHDTFTRFATMICPEGVTIIDLETEKKIYLSGANVRGFEYTHLGQNVNAAFGHTIAKQKQAHEAECEVECEVECEDACSDDCDDCDRCAGCEKAAIEAKVQAQAALAYAAVGQTAAHAEQKVAMEHMRARLRELRSSEGRMAQFVHMSEAQRREHEARARKYMQEVKQLMAKAEREAQTAEHREEQAEQLMEKAEQYAEAGKHEKAKAMHQKAEGILREMEERYRNAEVIEAQAERTEAAAERAERDAERVEDTAERYEEAIEELMERIEELEEELEELSEALAERAGSR